MFEQSCITTLLKYDSWFSKSSTNKRDETFFSGQDYYLEKYLYISIYTVFCLLGPDGYILIKWNENFSASVKVGNAILLFVSKWDFSSEIDFIKALKIKGLELSVDITFFKKKIILSYIYVTEESKDILFAFKPLTTKMIFALICSQMQ